MTLTPYYASGGVTIYHGDSLDVLQQLDALTAIVTDPPYGISFMGKKWDSFPKRQAGNALAFRDAMRVVFELALVSCSPGAHLLAFGGTRTFHRLACGIEDAGWELRDCLSWLYGSGFPKSRGISDAIAKAAGAALTDGAPDWSGYGTALKPAWEPIILARKPLQGTVAANVLEHGCGALAIEKCRIAASAEDVAIQRARSGGEMGASDGRAIFGAGQRRPAGNDAGRWPANVVLDEEAARGLDEQSGESTSAASRSEVSEYSGLSHTPFLRGRSGPSNQRADRGGASRFFYTAKADKSDRSSGGFANNTHPTVKPTDLMRWLVRLVAMPSRNLICDPFMGSGSTLVAARAESVPCIGIELEEKSCEIAAKRLSQGVLGFNSDTEATL